jgi:hypothetical protein
MKTKHSILAALCSLFCLTAIAADKPNILVIMGDDIGIFNLSAYHQGMMGYGMTDMNRYERASEMSSS